MADEPRDPWLLTPGPLTTSLTVKQAMLHDWGSRDVAFIDANRAVRERLVALAGAEQDHVCVPLQGSGTFAVEASIGTLIPPEGKALILINGAYGKRMARICDYYRRNYATLETPEDVPNDVAALERTLAGDAAISHVLCVYCETTSGMLNPLQAIAEATERAGRKLIIDAMSAFGALPLNARETPFSAVVASSNKCLEGVPGLGFAIIRRADLAACEGNSPSLALDLHAQWLAMEGNGQWRFTPPTHAIFALARALDEHAAEGGVAGRGRRYRRNCEILTAGMREMGFTTLLPDALQAPIIVTFHRPPDPHFDFQDFYDRLNALGFVIYPGKLTVAESFRIGCIGRIGATEMHAALDAIRATIAELGVTELAPRAAA